MTGWVRDPFGSCGPAEFVRERVKALKARARAVIEEEEKP